MGISPALTSDERTALAGPSTVLRYLSPIPDHVVATARVNQLSFVYPLVALTVDGTSAGWSNIREGQTVYVGSTSGGKERGIYRVRQAGNSTTIFLEEQGSQDAGQLVTDIRTGSFANDDYVTIVERADLWTVLPRITGTTTDAVIYEDFDDTVGTRNTTPENIANITINGEENHYAILIADDEVAAITAIATATKWPTSSGSTVTHTWLYPGAFEDVSGDTTDTLTANVPPGNYVVYYTQHDSIGGDTLRIIHINIHDKTTNPPLLISEMPKADTRDRIGRKISFDLYDDRLTELVNGAMVIYFETCTWGGADVPSATRQFVGWVQREEWGGDTGLRQATLDIVGPAVLLGLMGSTTQVIAVSASPTTWQQAVPSLMSAAFMAWYMLRRRTANVLRLFNFTVYSTDPVGQRLPEWIIDKGSVLQQMQSLATDRGNFGANSYGSLFFLRHPNLINYDDRSGVVFRDSLDASIYSKPPTVQVQKYPQTQQVRGEAFSWDGSAVEPTPYYSDAPKVPGQGNDQIKLPSQVVTGQDELDQLTGDRYAQSNNKYPQIDVTILKNRDVYEPAEMEMVSVAIPARYSPTNADWTKQGIPISVSKRHNDDGTSDINLSLEGETHNIEGDDVPVPEGNDTVYTPPYVPPATDPLPPIAIGDIPVPGSVPPTDPVSTAPSAVPGKAAIRNTPTVAYCTYDITPSAPAWSDRNVPAWFTAISMMVHDEGTPFSRGAYLLGDNGTDSRVAYTKDIYETTPVWILGDTVDGLFTIIKSVRNIAGAVYIYGGGPSGSSDWDMEWDLTVAPGPFTSGTRPFGVPNSHWVNGAGWENIDLGENFGIERSEPVTSFSHRTITYVEFSYNISPSIAGQSAFAGIGFRLFLSGSEVSNSAGTFTIDPSGVGSNTYDYTTISPFTGVDADAAYLDLRSGGNSGATVLITHAKIKGTDGNPFGPYDFRSRYSTDFASTFADEQDVDTLTGTPGFDVGRAGITALAGGDEHVRTALAGGTYANTVNGGASGSYPISIVIPDTKVGSVSVTNTAEDPDFVFAAPIEIASHALWKVTLAGKVGITPVIGGNKALGVEPLGLEMWRGKRIMYIGEADGTRYLFVTKDTAAHWGQTTMALAHSVRIRRFSPNGYEAIVAAGTNGLKYTANGGVTWSTKTASGDNIFAQLFG